jgi:hypothetical protein
VTEDICGTPRCDYPRPADQFICRNCELLLKRDLGDIPALIEDLNTTLSRQDKLGASAGGKGAESAVPFKAPAADVLYLLAHTTTGWVRVLAEDTRQVIHTLPLNPVQCARWLLVHVRSLCLHEAGGEAVDEIAYAVAEAYRVIDRPPDLLLAGQCDWQGCQEFLYATPQASVVQCRACEHEHAVEERRAWMMEYASDLNLPAILALGWIKLLMGKRIPRGTWDSWVSRGRIAAAERDHVGSALYRFGDVRDLAADWVARPRKEAVA